EGEVVELLVHGAAEEGARRNAERTAECVPAGHLDPREDELRELREHLPAAFRPDRAQDRLHVAGRVADDLARHQLAVRDDRARVLADRLAVAGDALVGVHREKHEVGADLGAARPVELPRERDRERRRLDARDLHRETVSTSMPYSSRAAAAVIFSSSTSRRIASRSRSRGSPKPPPPGMRWCITSPGCKTATNIGGMRSSVPAALKMSVDEAPPSRPPSSPYGRCT